MGNAEERNEMDASVHNIHLALAPRVAVLNSPDVSEVLGPNGFLDFAELLKPFQDDIEGVSVRTSQLETRHCRTFPLSFDMLDHFSPTSFPTSSSSLSLFTPADALSPSAQESRKSSEISVDPQPFHQPSSISRPEALLDMINSTVSALSCGLENRIDCKVGSADNREIVEDHFDSITYQSAPLERLTPWFTASRDTIFKFRNVSEHETFGHPVAIVMVVSASSTDPMNAFASLFEASQPHANRAFSQRPYVDPLVLRYYVLLHDISRSGGDLSESVELLELVKKTYGIYCCLLPINSIDPTQDARCQSSNLSHLWQSTLSHDTFKPSGQSSVTASIARRLPASLTHEIGSKPSTLTAEDSEGSGQHTKTYGRLLNDDDVRRIKSFVRELASQNIVPFLERCVSLWNEQLAASRKGLTGRLFGAGRKFFATASSRGSSTQSSISFTSLGYYPHSSLEAQTRRLADFAFITRDYKLAAAMYDLGRKDYANDKAHKYLGGANEMFGLAHLMMMLTTPSSPIDVDSYLASACSHYTAAPRSRGSALQTNSLKATLLFYEAYRALSYYTPAPIALVRLATERQGSMDNDIEVAGALLLEQAAISDVRRSNRPALRKCALHLTMAAHRYGSCGQKGLSYRCFRAAASAHRALRTSQVAIAPLGEIDPAISPSMGPKGIANSNEDEGVHLSDIIARDQGHRAEWDLIGKHIEHQLAECANVEGNVEQAIVHFLHLLRRRETNFQIESDGKNAKEHALCLDGFLASCRYIEKPLADVLHEYQLPPNLALVDARGTCIRMQSGFCRSSHMTTLPDPTAEFSRSVAPHTERSVAVDENFIVELSLINTLSITLAVNTLTVEFDRLDGIESDEEPLSEKIDIVKLKAQRHNNVPVKVKSPGQTGLFRLARVRYILQGQVDMVEELNKHGARLSNTKAQRSSEKPVYALDDTLTVMVHEPKPSIHATLIAHSSTLGLGEEIKASVELRNVGKAALQALRASSSSPASIMSDEIAQGLPEDTTAIAVLQTQKVKEIMLSDGKLNPGDSVLWPIIIRGATIGHSSVRLMFSFTALDGEVLQTSIDHHFQVEPVLGIAIRAEPSRIQESNTYDLSLEVVNHSSPGEIIAINCISLLSPSWRARPTQRQVEYFNHLEPLESQKSRYATFAVVRSENGSCERAYTDFLVEQLKALLSGRDVHESLQAPSIALTRTDFLRSGFGAPRITSSVTTARREWHRAYLARQFASIPDKLRQHVFAHYQPSEVDVVVHWTMLRSKRQGQNFLFGLQLGPAHDRLREILGHANKISMRTLYTETELEKAAMLRDLNSSDLHLEEEPLIVSTNPPTSLVHDFYKIGRAVFAVPLNVRNLSPARCVDFVLQLEEGAHADRHRASWADRLTFRGSLKPLESVTLSAKATVSSAGPKYLATILVKARIKDASGAQGIIVKEFTHREEGGLRFMEVSHVSS